MSAIGDYVHYNASRYMKYGTSKNEDGQKVSSSTWHKITRSIRKKVIRTNYNSREIKEIEEKYNYFRRLVTEGSESEYKEIREKIKEKMLENFSSQLDTDKTIFSFERGDVYNLDKQAVQKDVQNLQQTPTSIRKNLSGKQITYLDTVLKRFKIAYQNLQEIRAVDEKKRVRQLLDEALIEFRAVAQVENQLLKELKLSGIHTSKDIALASTAKEALNKINIAFGLSESQNLGKVLGTFEEYIGHAIVLAIKGVTLNSLNNWEKEFNTSVSNGGSKHTWGSTGADKIIDIDQDILAQLKSSFIIKDKNGKYSFNTKYHSEQKMDVSLTYDGVGGTDPKKLSIKNYNLFSTSPIHIVTASPLSTFLFNIGDIDVTNHFLNIFASHKNPSSSFRECRKIADNAFALQLLWAGLSGKGAGKTSGFADIFVVNNNKSNKNEVKMWDIGALINNIIKKGDLQKDLITKPEISKIVLDNRRATAETNEKAVQKRLAILIVKAHEEKIEASIAKRVLQY